MRAAVSPHVSQVRHQSPMVSFLAAIPRRLAAVSVLAAALLWSAPSPAQTVYSVTNTADAGAGSLRQAVTSLNGSGAEGIISFVTGSSGTIGLASGLTLTRQASLLNASGGGVTVRLSGTSNLAALTATSLGTLGGASALAIEATGTGSNVSAISSASTLTIGSIGATASITATAVEDDVYGIRAVGDMTVTGQLAGSVTASSTVWMGFRAYGLASDTGSVTIGSIAETGRILAEIASDSSYGISGATGVTIVGEMAGDIEAVSGVGFSIGSDAYGLYSSGGAISIGAIAETGSITARGEASSAYGIRASGDVAIGRMAGDISATSEMGFSAYGILSANGSITIGSIAETGSISSLSGASFTGAVFATTGDVEITGAMAGRISATSTADAGGGTHVYGIAAYDGAVTIGSIAATGVISALAARERAYAVYADGDLTIAGGMAGMISATAGGHTALGIWSGGTLGGGGASTPVSISGTVSAQAGGLAVAVGANGTMNLYVTGTLSGVDASGGGNGYAIRAGASNGIGGWTTGNADNTVTLGTGAHLVGKVDLGTGNNTLNLIGTGSAANLFVGVDTLVAGDGTTATSWTLNPVAADASIYGAVTVNPLASLTVNENVALPATVLDNGNLTFDLATNLGYAGVISGSGSLTKTGEAALFLIGATTYTGTTLVAEGGLNIIQTLNSRSIGIYAGATLDLDQDYTAQDYAMVNGTLIVPELTVARGATLYGSGTIQGDVTDNGTISPGNSPGTLTILGNLTLNSGSLLSMEITPSANDLLAVSGTTTIHGGTLSAFVSQGFYANGQSFVLLTSGGGITGIFDAMSVNCASPFLHFEFDEDADSIEVSVTRLPYTMAGTSRNS
ncbi:MAG: beta strand repeat-containing protein, partial [Thermodesulfobacteriota bacterium]